MSEVHFCINTHNNLPYLKLAVNSVREYAFFNNAEFHIYAENCTDGTNEWLEKNKEELKLNTIIETNETPIGIGGGMNKLADQIEFPTDLIIFLHSDMFVSRNFDLPLYNYITNNKGHLLVSSHRMEPNIFGQRPHSNQDIWLERYGTLMAKKEVFGFTHENFDQEKFLTFAHQFVSENGHEIIPKGEGAGGFIIRKSDWDFIGGNDPRFAPASYEDMDLFVRMKNAGFKFPLLYDSLIWHFGARGSHFPDDNFSKSSDRQKESEKKNLQKFIDKWGKPPEFDKFGMVKKIKK